MREIHNLPMIHLMPFSEIEEKRACEAALKACHIPLDRISPKDVDRTLKELPSYCYQHNLAFGLAHTLNGEDYLYRNLYS